jgi:hypothetical protein
MPLNNALNHTLKNINLEKYKEIYKADINLLKELINYCGEFNEKQI